MKLRAFITHKVKENYSDCQDRFGVNPNTKSIAVSDGMGASWQQKIWAQLLVKTFIEEKEWLPTKDSIKLLCDSWRKEVVSFIQHLKDTNAAENLIYRNERYLVEKRSAGATFVGIQFDGNHWSGSVLGDSCLIEWDGEEAIFHTSQNEEFFDNNPDYFDSDASKEGKGIPKNISGSLSNGSWLFLVSDPFSDFLLEHRKQGDIATYIQQLLSIFSHEDFENVVAEWRQIGMHNDDTTLVVVEGDDDDTFVLQQMDNIETLIEKENDGSDVEIIDNSTQEKQNVETGITAPQQIDNPHTVKEDDLVEEFITIVKDFFNKKKIKKLKCLKFNNVTRAIREAIHTLLEKYEIIEKQ